MNNVCSKYSVITAIPPHSWTAVGCDRAWLCARCRVPHPDCHSDLPHREDGEEAPRHGRVSRRQ